MSVCVSLRAGAFAAAVAVFALPAAAQDIAKSGFIATRAARDVTQALPGRMLAALQVTIRGGRLPEAEGNGHSYLKIPVGKFDPR